MKRYKIEHIGNYEDSLYFITAYNVDIPLIFLLDSGCTSNLICEKALKKM